MIDTFAVIIYQYCIFVKDFYRKNQLDHKPDALASNIKDSTASFNMLSEGFITILMIKYITFEI